MSCTVAIWPHSVNLNYFIVKVRFYRANQTFHQTWKRHAGTRKLAGGHTRTSTNICLSKHRKYFSRIGRFSWHITEMNYIWIKTLTHHFRTLLVYSPRRRMLPPGGSWICSFVAACGQQRHLPDWMAHTTPLFTRRGQQTQIHCSTRDLVFFVFELFLTRQLNKKMKGEK